MSAWINKKDWMKNHIQKRRSREAESTDDKKEDEYCVEFFSVKCPRCKSKKSKIYKTDLPVRYHRCSDCNLRFKSIEN